MNKCCRKYVKFDLFLSDKNRHIEVEASYCPECGSSLVESDLVYCSDCRYISGEGEDAVCNHPQNKIGDWYSDDAKKISPSRINHHNNCVWYVVKTT